MGLADVIASWKDFGIFEFYLPFVLMFAIFYGLLSKSKLFGEPNEKRVRNINVIVSIVAALFVMVYPPSGITLTTFFGTFFTQIMVVLTAILCFALILYMMLPAGTIENMVKDPWNYAKFLLPIAAIIVLIIFFAAGGPELFGISDISIVLPGLGLSTEDIVTIILIVLFIIVIWFIVKGDEEKAKKAPKKGGLGGFEAGGYRFPGSH